MMRVLVEIHPHGDSKRKRTIASIDLANVTELDAISNYEITGRTDRLSAFRFRLDGHERARGWIPLVRRALNLLHIAEKEAPLGDLR